MAWTDERVELMKKLLSEGLSFAQVARRLGEGVTRNAAIGKAARIGFSGRSGTKNANTQRQRHKSPTQMKARKANALKFGATNNLTPRPAFHAKPEPFIVVAEDLVIPLHERKTLLVMRGDKMHANDEFGESCCRWPIGDVGHPDFHFCGKEKVAGLSYCEFHSRRAFQPPQVPRPPLREAAGGNFSLDERAVLEFLKKAAKRQSEVA